MLETRPSQRADGRHFKKELVVASVVSLAILPTTVLFSITNNVKKSVSQLNQYGLFLLRLHQVGNASGARSALGASASVVDGSFFLGGYTSGSWAGLSTGGYDFAAVKIHSNGTLAWIWQVRIEH